MSKHANIRTIKTNACLIIVREREKDKKYYSYVIVQYFVYSYEVYSDTSMILEFDHSIKY